MTMCGSGGEEVGVIERVVAVVWPGLGRAAQVRTVAMQLEEQQRVALEMCRRRHVCTCRKGVKEIGGVTDKGSMKSQKFYLLTEVAHLRETITRAEPPQTSALGPWASFFSDASALRRCSSTFLAISSFLSLRAMQKRELARIFSPCQMKMNGMAHMSRLRPPSRLQAPAMPSRANMGAVAKGRTVASSEREQLAAAFADAANISYASTR